VEHVGPVSHVVDSVYMVGKIKSNPPLETPWILPAHYGYYWFGDLPTNIRAIRDIHYDFYTKVSEFFNDSGVDPTYRSFVRSNSKNMDFMRKSFGGTPFTQSQIFDYDDQITSIGDYDLVRLMSHELVRNFLGPKDPDDIDWLFEGISNVLSIYLPFRNGFRTSDYFSSTLSMLCMKYYTSPLIRVPLPELIEHAPVNEYAKEFLAAKAWAFVIACDFRARDISKSTLKLQRPIEDLAIKVLAQKRAKDEPYGIDQWIDLLWPLMGDDVLLKYEAMHQGTITLLPTELFGAKTHKLIYCEQEKLDFGMDRESFDLGIVTNLKPRSRADQAGLIEGDVIVWSTHLQRCVDHFEEEMDVVVMRNGKEHRIRYWPRMLSKADSWKMVKLEEVPDVARLTI
jgi:predicted metalloprotease with PDZ domain